MIIWMKSWAIDTAKLYWRKNFEKTLKLGSFLIPHIDTSINMNTYGKSKQLASEQ